MIYKEKIYEARIINNSLDFKHDNNIKIKYMKEEF